MTNTNATNLRKNLFSYLDSTIEYNDIINVNTKKGNVIIISESEYNGLLETLYLLSDPIMKEKLEADKIYILKKANKDKENIKQFPALKNNVDKLIALIKKKPFQTPPPYESLIGDLKGYYSRRINKQHKLVYEVIEDEKRINIISMWKHYEF